MQKPNRRGVLGTLGCAVAALVAYPFSRTALADREGERRHPRIHRAIVALEEAKRELEEAPHDFGGHKKTAIDAIVLSVDELEICRDFRR